MAGCSGRTPRYTITASPTSPTAATGLISDKMIDGLSVAGKPDYCLRRIGEIVDGGLKHLVLNLPLSNDPFEAMELVVKDILPSF